MYQVVPKRTNTKASGLILLFFAGAAALMLITMLVPSIPFRWVFQLISLFLLTVAIFFVTRYSTKSFFYRIESRGGEDRGDLTVTETDTKGKKQITVCRVGVCNVIRCDHLKDPKQAEGALIDLKKRRIKLFDYTVDFHPADSILVLVNEGEEELAIRLSFDLVLLQLLTPAEEESTQN